MRRIKKHQLILLPLCLVAVLGFSGELARSGSGPDSAWSNAMNKYARFMRHQDPLPTPTPFNNALPASSPTPAPAKTKAPQISAASTTTQPRVLSSEGGILTARMVTTVPPASVNLTNEGTVDWAHWGNGGPQVFNHKANVAQQISTYSVIGTSQIFWLGDNPTTFSWNDGTPNASANNVRTGVFALALGNGFQFTVPADTNIKTLRVYLGLWSARGRFEASLSDGSAPIYLDKTLLNQNATSNGVYTISFAAASAGQTLTIKYTVETSFAGGSGNVTLEGATLVNGGDPDVPPIVNITSPENEATYNSNDTITITANAFDTDGSIAAVQFYSDGFLLGNGTASGSNEYSFTWDKVFAGNHVVTAVATDNEGAKSTSSPINITALPVDGGAIAGGLLVPNPPGSINLTTEGTLDWAHWGNGGAKVFDHKTGVTQQISDATLIGTSAASWFADYATLFNWTDGTPNATGTNNKTGIFVSSIGNGFEITVPADTTYRTVRLFTGFWNSQTKLEAALSDGSAPAFVNTSFGGTNLQDGIYAISYRAASAGQTLRLRYTILTDYIPPFGNIRLAAVTLSTGTPPSVNLTSPVNGAIYAPGEIVTVTAAASDPDGISKVELFINGMSIGAFTAPPYTTTWASDVAGPFSVYAVATDGKGVPSTSAVANVLIDNAPEVSAGYNQTIVLPALATLNGTVSDDGFPAPSTITTSWSKVSGPGTVSFGNANSVVTTASFSAEGDYVLRLTASDGARSSSSDVSVGVRSTVTMSLSALADAHVRDGSSATTNFGSATLIEVQTGNTGENRDAYFKFDLTNVGDISNAKLRLNASLSAAGSVATSVYPVANTSWTEAAINWNNKSPLGTPVLSTVTINGTTASWYELDVTNYLIAEKSAGRNTVTLGLHNQSTSTQFVRINSKEAASNKPELSIVTTESTFVTDKTLGTLRNNLSAWVGMKLTVGPSPIVVTALGRIFVNGNTGTHTLKFVNASSGADVPGSSVSINMAAGVASNGFKYAALPAPIALAANTAYYLASQETNGGDQWYDSNTVLTSKNIAVVNNAVQKPNNNWQSAGSTNNSFVPLDFKYVSKTAPTDVTYHLHAEGSIGPGLMNLSKSGPDRSATGTQTNNLKGAALGEKFLMSFSTQVPILGSAGYIPAGATTTFTLWMRNTGTAGTMFPRAKLFLNSDTGAQLCTVTGGSALTGTTTKYVLSCATSSDITVNASDRFYLWIGVNLTAGSSSKNFSGELSLEGVLNGNFDSQITTLLPLVPTIYQLTPNIGPNGSVVTIAGTNFGSMQGLSTVKFNSVSATVSSWSANSIVATVPAMALTGPTVVTVKGAASNGVTFTIGLLDSDADGLADAWELQYFGNLSQGPNGDFDGDGATNLQEFVQGRNPTVGSITDINSWINLRFFPPIDP